jgi:hypothetical protein
MENEKALNVSNLHLIATSYKEELRRHEEFRRRWALLVGAAALAVSPLLQNVSRWQQVNTFGKKAIGWNPSCGTPAHDHRLAS